MMKPWNRRAPYLAFSIAVATAAGPLAGCSSSDAGGQAPSVDAGSGVGDAGARDASTKSCTKLVVKGLERDPEFGLVGQKYSALLGTVEPALGTAVPDEFQIQLYEFKGPQAPGTFDLGAGDETNFATCAHCVLVFEDMNAEGKAARYFFQTAGELTLTVNPTPTTGEVRGSLKNLRLVEVTIDYAGETFESTPVPNGSCFEVDALDINTTAPLQNPDAG